MGVPAARKDAESRFFGSVAFSLGFLASKKLMWLPSDVVIGDGQGAVRAGQSEAGKCQKTAPSGSLIPSLVLVTTCVWMECVI